MSELNEKLATAWEGFTKGDWQNEVNVRDFIQKNYTPYEGDESFLAGATEATTTLWDKVMEGVKLENRTHAPVDFDTAVASTITSHDAGYINKQLEKIVGLQTEAPLKRALIPFGPSVFQITRFTDRYQNDRRFLQSVQPRTGPDDQKNLH
ncbi:hypothetical protein EIMP300_65400 [Escherichia coli]|uniref:PFL domain-containing protein n=1 Tax=Escherichia coli TaxID=562 RepID=A0A8S0FZE6_ECOLX|nr:hypothetical protein EIMP300_65400 [Escherichia coli]